MYFKLNTKFNQSFGLSECVVWNWVNLSPLEDPVLPVETHTTSSSPLLFRLALLWAHSLLWLCFGCFCRGRGRGGGGRWGGGRGWAPSGLHSCAGHLQFSAFCEGSVVDTFQKEALPLAAVESLMREEEDKDEIWEKKRETHTVYVNYITIILL